MGSWNGRWGGGGPGRGSVPCGCALPPALTLSFCSEKPGQPDSRCGVGVEELAGGVTAPPTSLDGTAAPPRSV